MTEYWETTYARGLQTIGVWQAFAPTFTAGEMTLAGHQTDAAALTTAAHERELQQDVVDVARSTRDTNMRMLEDPCIRFPRLLEGCLTAEDELHAEIADIRSVNPDSPDRVMQRARRVISLWKRVNALRAAASPSQTELKVGTQTVAELQTVLERHAALLQAVETERGKLTLRREGLRSLASKVDRNNKRWFAAWEGNFAEGSPEREALRQINTGQDTPIPTVLEIAVVAPIGPGAVAITYTEGGGYRATSLELLWQRVGMDAGYTNRTLAVPAGQEIRDGFANGMTINFKTRVGNSTGEVESVIKPVLMP